MKSVEVVVPAGCKNCRAVWYENVQDQNRQLQQQTQPTAVSFELVDSGDEDPIAVRNDNKDQPMRRHRKKEKTPCVPSVRRALKEGSRVNVLFQEGQRRSDWREFKGTVTGKVHRRLEWYYVKFDTGVEMEVRLVTLEHSVSTSHTTSPKLM